MPRRVVSFSLAWMLTLAVSTAARAAAPPEVVRLELPARGQSDIEFRADSLPNWEEDTERVVALGGQVLIAQGTTSIRGSRAVVWVAKPDPKQNAISRGIIYVEGDVQLEIADKKQIVQAAVLSFATSGQLNFKGKIENKSIAKSAFYVRALLARQPTLEQPVPLNVRVPDGTSNPILMDRAGAPNGSIASPSLDSAAIGVNPAAPRYDDMERVQFKEPSGGSSAAPKLDPVPGSPGGPVAIEPPTFASPTISLPNVSTRRLKLSSRTTQPFYLTILNVPNGEQIALLTGGVKLLAFSQDKGGAWIDIEAEQIVVWQTGGKTQDLVDAMRDANGAAPGQERQIEVYLSGNVVLRFATASEKRNPEGSPVEDKVVRADRGYYDVNQNKGLFLKADIEFLPLGFKDPAHFRADEFQLLSLQESVARKSNANASKLPGDPGLNLRNQRVTITEEKDQVIRSIFGFPVIDRETEKEEVGSIRRFKTRNTFIELGGVPIFYLPTVADDVNDPAGPLQLISYRNDQIFGTQVYSTSNLLNAFGIKKLPNERWNLMADYLDRRGPALGTVYDLAAPKFFGFEAPFSTHFLAYGIYDKGQDQLGGPRSNDFVPTDFRGRVDFHHIQEYDDFYFQGQVAYLSDRNFLEQYYKFGFDMGPNQETFADLKYQHGNGAVSILAQPNLARPWVTETQWLPKLDGYWLGQSFFDRFTYNTWGSAAYANLQTFNLPVSELPPGRPPIGAVVESPVRTGRFDWMQQISAPIDAGALQLVPYANLDLAYYTQDNAGNARGRIYGGGGVRSSVPFSRLYEEVDSEFFNLHGIYHKVSLNANYYNAWTNTPASLLPQLDRLNDDATQQSIRDIKPWLPFYLPGPAGEALFNSPMYDSRLYAIRRLLDTKPDTLDTIQVLQVDARQRWQTKRGYEGMEHTVDYVTLDLSASIFPTSNRDNFGHPVSFLEYNATWAVGDRNGITSSGWFDPFSLGTRYWNLSTYYNRPDGTSISLSYRQLDPINSRVLAGSLSYAFSPKYAVLLSASYDLSIANNEGYMLNITRTGTDLTWGFGVSYSALVHNFSLNFFAMPNLLAQRGGGGVDAQNPFGTTGGMYGRQ